MTQEDSVAMNKATKRVLDLFENTSMRVTQFEKAVGLTDGTIKNLRNGRNNASADTICRIAEYFEVTTDYIMGYTDFPKSPTSWYVFRRIATRLNKSWDAITKELNKPLSFFVDWEHGQEPTPRELWAICNTWQLKGNPFEKIKKPTELKLSPDNIPAVFGEMSDLLNEQRFVDSAKLYRAFPDEKRERVCAYIFGIATGLGLNVQQILGK